VLSIYKALSAVVGRRAVISVSEVHETVEILDIDEEARLVVKDASGIRTLNSGEIISFEVNR
jgi:biotin-(acetyl-CoA carboxylase) ligase